MKATDELRHEHIAILSVLDLAVSMLRSEQPNKNDLADILDFFSDFIDKCHHAKEEDMLFPALAEMSDECLKGLLLDLEEQHETGRVLVATMRHHLNTWSDEEALLLDLELNLEQYRQMLLKHIEIENDQVFPVADQCLSEARHVKLKRDFDLHEEREIGEGRHEELHDMIDGWQAKYG